MRQDEAEFEVGYALNGVTARDATVRCCKAYLPDGAPGRLSPIHYLAESGLKFSLRQYANNSVSFGHGGAYSLQLDVFRSA